jgi:hypothetical protein
MNRYQIFSIESAICWVMFKRWRNSFISYFVFLAICWTLLHRWHFHISCKLSLNYFGLKSLTFCVISRVGVGAVTRFAICGVMFNRWRYSFISYFLFLAICWTLLHRWRFASWKSTKRNQKCSSLVNAIKLWKCGTSPALGIMQKVNDLRPR